MSKEAGAGHDSLVSQQASTAMGQVVTVEVHEATERIKVRMRRAAEDLVAIGQDLNLIKEQLPHGAFMPYIKQEFGMSQATAERFMRVAERFGDKIVTMTNMPPTALYTLSEPSVSDEVADAVLAEVAAGKVKPSVKAVKAAIAQQRPRTDSSPATPVRRYRSYEEAVEDSVMRAHEAVEGMSARLVGRFPLAYSEWHEPTYMREQLLPLKEAGERLWQALWDTENLLCEAVGYIEDKREREAVAQKQKPARPAARQKPKGTVLTYKNATRRALRFFVEKAS